MSAHSAVKGLIDNYSAKLEERCEYPRTGVQKYMTWIFITTAVVFECPWKLGSCVALEWLKNPTRRSQPIKRFTLWTAHLIQFLSGFSFYNTKCKVRKWFEPGSNIPWLNDHLGAVKLLDSEDGFRTGCRNISRQQQSFSGLQSPRSLLSIKVHENCCIVAMHQSLKIIYAFVVENRITYLLI